MSTLDITALGARIRVQRKAMKASQEEIAGCVGVRRNAIAAIERAVVVDPGIQTLAGIAYALGLTLAELVDPENATNGKGA